MISYARALAIGRERPDHHRAVREGEDLHIVEAAEEALVGGDLRRLRGGYGRRAALIFGRRYRRGRTRLCQVVRGGCWDGAAAQLARGMTLLGALRSATARI